MCSPPCYRICKNFKKILEQAAQAATAAVTVVVIYRVIAVVSPY